MSRWQQKEIEWEKNRRKKKGRKAGEQGRKTLEEEKEKRKKGRGTGEEDIRGGERKKEERQGNRGGRH